MKYIMIDPIKRPNVSQIHLYNSMPLRRKSHSCSPNAITKKTPLIKAKSSNERWFRISNSTSGNSKTSAPIRKFIWRTMFSRLTTPSQREIPTQMGIWKISNRKRRELPILVPSKKKWLNNGAKKKQHKLPPKTSPITVR